MLIGVCRAIQRSSGKRREMGANEGAVLVVKNFEGEMEPSEGTSFDGHGNVQDRPSVVDKEIHPTVNHQSETSKALTVLHAATSQIG